MNLKNISRGAKAIKKYFLTVFILFLLLSSCIPLIIGTTSDVNIVLVKSAADYLDYGFEDLGVYYTPEALTVFNMPFIVERTGIFNNLNKYDLDGYNQKGHANLNKRFINYDFSILASNDNYFVINFQMNVRAGPESFSVDFVPRIKNVEFPQFAYWNSSYNNYVPITINPNFGTEGGYTGWVNETINASENLARWTGLEYDTQGRPHLVYESDSLLHYTYRTTGGTWRGQENTTGADNITAAGTGIAIAIDTNDIPHIVAGHSTGLKYCVWNTTGNKWDIEYIDTPGDWGAGNTVKDIIDIDSSGNPCVVYCLADRSGYNYTYRLSNGTWRGIQNHTRPDTIHSCTSANYYSLTLDSSDVPHISGAQDGDSRDDLIYITYTTDWEVTNINTETGMVEGNGLDSIIKLDASQYPHIIIHSDGTGLPDPDATFHTWYNGATWQYEEVFYDDADHLDFEFNSSGAIWLTFSHPGGSDPKTIYAFGNFTGSNWNNNETLDYTAGTFPQPCLALKQDDSIGIVFHSETGLYYYLNSTIPSFVYVDTNLKNFPILVNVSAAISANCDSGNSIRFLALDNTTEYYYDIDQTWNDNSFNHVWVNLTTLNGTGSGNQMILMYYNNSVVSVNESANTWDTDYTFVGHLNEESGTTCYDASTYGNDGTYANDLPDVNTGRIGYGQDFDGTDDYITLPDGAANDRNGTIECWFEADSAAKHTLTQIYGNSNYYIQLLPYNTGGDINFLGYYKGGNEWDLLNGDYEANEFFYTAGTYGGTIARLYMNNTLLGTDSTVNSDGFTITEFLIGVNQGYANDVNGVIDEYRFSKIARNQSWINASFHSSNQSTGFITFGTPAVGPMTAPSLFNATTLTSSSIGLSWVNGENTTSTYINYKTSGYPNSPSDGTNIYNSDGTSFTHSSLSCNTTYYYRAWGYNSSIDGYSSFVNTTNLTCPGNAFNYTTVYFQNTLNISWYNPNNADQTVLVRKTGVYPSSYNDGNILYNGTNTSLVDGSEHFNDTGAISTNYYYSLFTYNSTINEYGSGTNLVWGSLTIRVFNETTGSAINNWNVFITDADGTNTYVNNLVNNPLIISVENLPYGDKTGIKINKTGNEVFARYYYLDLNPNNHYELNAHLPPTDTSELKAINVVGPQTYFNTNPPIEDANIVVSTYINETTGYGNCSILYSDANGQCFIYMQNDKEYKVNITKAGYETEVSDITTKDEIDSYTFRLNPEGFTPTELFSFWDQVTFTVELSGEYMQDGNITVTFIDSNNTMINTDIYIYEYYGGVSTLINHSRNASNSFSYRIGGINTTRDHYVKLFFNSTADFYDASPIDFFKFAIWVFYGGHTRFSFDERVTNVIGPMTINGVNIGWHTLLSILLCFGFIILLGPYDVGLSLIGGGLVIAFTQGIFSLWFTDTFPPGLIALIPIFIIAGIIYFWTKGTGGDWL